VGLGNRHHLCQLQINEKNPSLMDGLKQLLAVGIAMRCHGETILGCLWASCLVYFDMRQMVVDFRIVDDKVVNIINTKVRQHSEGDLLRCKCRFIQRIIAQCLWCAQRSWYCWNRNVFKLRWKVALWRSGFCRSSNSDFQFAGAAMAKARRPYVFSWNLGATSKLRLAERMLSFSKLSDRHAQLRQVVGCLAVKTLVCHPAELVRDSKCHIEPVQLSVKELCQTTVVLACDAHDSCCSVHESLQLVNDSLGWSGQQDVAVVQPRRYKSMDESRCRLSVEWDARDADKKVINWLGDRCVGLGVQQILNRDKL